MLLEGQHTKLPGAAWSVLGTVPVGHEIDDGGTHLTPSLLQILSLGQQKLPPPHERSEGQQLPPKHVSVSPQQDVPQAFAQHFPSTHPPRVQQDPSAQTGVPALQQTSAPVGDFCCRSAGQHSPAMSLLGGTQQPSAPLGIRAQLSPLAYSQQVEPQPPVRDGQQRCFTLSRHCSSYSHRYSSPLYLVPQRGP